MGIAHFPTIYYFWICPACDLERPSNMNSFIVPDNFTRSQVQCRFDWREQNFSIRILISAFIKPPPIFIFNFSTFFFGRCRCRETQASHKQ